MAFWNCESVRMISRASTCAASTRTLAEGRGDDAAGDALAEADDQIGDAGGGFEDRGQATQDFIERVEFLSMEVNERGDVGRVLDQCGSVSRWRERSRELMAKAPVRSPSEAAAAARSNWSVTLAMALTTTTGFCPATRPATMAAVRPMAAGSSTDVPPNFITTRLMRNFPIFRR